MDHLVGTPALKPYMHGYFISLKLYDTARVIANPFVHEEHRQRMVKEKLDKLSETRIRMRKDALQPKVNKALAEKISREADRERRREERNKRRLKGKGVEMDAKVDGSKEDGAMEGGDAEPVGIDGSMTTAKKSSLLTDERFKALFEDPEFEVDPNSREYNLLNPSTADLVWLISFSFSFLFFVAD